MPTRKQLSEMWEAEFEFPEIRRDDDPAKVQAKHHTEPFTGEYIGSIAFNPETGDLKITPSPKDK